ncbi:MAG: flagellar biosynthesis protein FlhF [Succinivibrio dextrinosolvens]|uniref:flagellar biosynthesis protein FlhF n=1 Tax=Succinivibrio sp. TaxID=2053619 RepID=UPI0025DA9F70|nr:flagellar biosynthesis protein FlhF [Succinivibrio sp.]MBQ9219779.1 flagellar biosynthesis protein FlhF [Succinivibrio sp.]MDY6416679.1 flagellar biosynthesis protein FlhF [Succinivibrio dextrinosolvens]MDY6420389.1 flagellar biosynthesis protein FlhF [Succinivibrio dextrinosolvens]
MKLKRFVAKDMRTALAKIKEELGAEAVIMSNKRVGPNVEIIAGVEGDIPVAPVKTQSRSKGQITSNIQEDSPLSRIIADDEVTLSSSKNKSEVKPVTKSVGGSKSEAFAKSLLEILERQQQSAPEVATEKKTAKTSKVKAKAPAPLSEQTGLRDLFIKEEEKKKEKKVESSHGISSYISKESESEKTEIEQLRHDVDSIRRLLQFELAGLMSDTKKREEPVRAMIYELLLSSGFDKSISNELSESIDSDASFNFAWRQLAQNLERRIKTGSDEIVTDGGIVTLIGPAGVGKTTTIAKLAARFVMKYGADRVALITADHYRIGAVEQVKTYGRIMGCSTFAIKSIDELPEMLYTLRDKSLVLVDTVGVGLHDERFESQVNALKKQSRLKMKHYLVLPATAQRKVLEHAYEHFSNIGLKGIILTKIDESESLADALSLCIKQKLMLSYVTDGQRVPEDLEVPDARALALKALSSVESDVAKFALEPSVL